MLILIPQPPHETRMGLLLPMEGDQWMVSLCGWHHDYAPTDRAGFLEYARTLPVPDLYQVLTARWRYPQPAPQPVAASIEQ